MDYSQIESSQRQHHEEMKHQEEMNLIIEREEYNLFTMIKPKLYKDGDRWCCLYGNNQMEGIVGFGETPFKAILEWNSAWHKGHMAPINSKTPNP